MSQAANRAAAVQFLKDYAAYAEVNLSVYPGRPRTIMPPHAFVDVIREVYVAFTEHHFQRSPQVEMIVIHGLFDSKDAVDQKDAFVDGFLEWVYDRPHAAGANTLIRVASTEDIPNYVPDWLPPDQQRVYFATQITLEGFGTN